MAIDQDTFKEASEALDTLIDRMNDLGEQVQALQDKTDDIDAQPIAEVEEALGDVLEKMQGVGEDMRQANESVLDAITATQSTIAEHTTATRGHVDNALHMLDEQTSQLNDVMQRTRDAILASTDQIAQAFSTHAEELKSAEAELIECLKRAFVEQLDSGNAISLEHIQDFLQTIDKSMQELFNVLASALGTLANALKDALGQAERERAPAQLALDQVKVVLDPLMDQVQRILSLAETVGVSV